LAHGQAARAPLERQGLASAAPCRLWHLCKGGTGGPPVIFIGTSCKGGTGGPPVIFIGTSCKGGMGGPPVIFIGTRASCPCPS